METQMTNSETDSELPLAEPHFDDEATLLSARRVVPLDEVRSYGSAKALRLTRRWMFAAIVLGSLLLGVVGGAGYYSYLNRGRAASFANTQNIISGVDGNSTEPAGNDVHTPIDAPEVNNATPADANGTLKEEPAPAPESISSNDTKRPVARRVDVLTFPSTREERKTARRQAKAQKRELGRESRDRNLMRIREIFEGPQKP
jgi:hypothetical protein